MSRANILQIYDNLRRQVRNGFYNPQITQTIDNLYNESLSILRPLAKETLISKVEKKTYFAFRNGRKISRAINSGLYDANYSKWQTLQTAMTANDLKISFNCTSDSLAEITKILYTIAISFCACVDLIQEGDQKTPGTFFEYFIAYFFTWRVGVESENSIQLLNIDGEDARLPTDFVFNLGAKQRKFHMPIKTSTRERSIMLWAHQRLLDGVYGIERFMGTPVLLAETKTDKRKKEVVEICLPEQWRVYQLYIAKLKRIYYLDLPVAYEKLSLEFPPLHVKPFATFFYEWNELLPS